MQVYCIVGARRGIGKTRLVEKVIEKLKEKRITVYTVKKSSKKIDLAEKDTSRHLNAGAELTLAVSPQDSVVILKRKNIEELIRQYIPENGVTLIEGFRESKYPKIIIVENLDDLKLIEKLDSKFIIACKNENLKRIIDEKYENLATCMIDDVNYIVNRIIEDSIAKVYERLPKLNCGLCGYKKCIKFAEAVIRGEEIEKCPMKIRVKITVNGKELKIKPYVELVRRKVIEGFLKSLKGFN
ncbi:MAG TPA: molybdopterin-guanine dinucleotide biosynthesis protein B, partial [Candidatus Atribacteria bacterium]|nr:molybdopterin-guanine dinucleotide biosynthesis protein B [Candidatus Atribacteria bacterium]